MKKNTLRIITLLAALLGITQTYCALPALQNYVTEGARDVRAIVRNNLVTVPEELEEVVLNYAMILANRPPLHEMLSGNIAAGFIAGILPEVPSLPYPLPHAHNQLVSGMIYFNTSNFLPATRKIPVSRTIFTVLAGCAVADCIKTTTHFFKDDLVSIPAIVGIYAGSIAGTLYLANKIQPFYKKPLQKYSLALSGTPTDVSDANTLESTFSAQDTCYICTDFLLREGEPLTQLPICKCTVPRYLHRECYLAYLKSSTHIKPCAHCNEPVYFPQQPVTLKLRNGATLTNF